VLVAKPARIEPTTKIEMDSWTSSFLLMRSASLPQMGVLAVAASRIVVMTQVYWLWLPSRSAMMRGSALATMVPESIDTNIASRSPDIDSSTSRCVISTATGAAGSSSRSAMVTVMMRPASGLTY
jgi:hypothetical protein